MHNLSDALSDLKKSIECFPIVKSYFRMGIVQRKLGRLKESIDAFDKCLEFGVNNEAGIEKETSLKLL